MSMPPAGFEPGIPAGEKLQIPVLDHSATGIGNNTQYKLYIMRSHPYVLIYLTVRQEKHQCHLI
jgi:hypothetical protein